MYVTEAAAGDNGNTTVMLMSDINESKGTDPLTGAELPRTLYGLFIAVWPEQPV